MRSPLRCTATAALTAIALLSTSAAHAASAPPDTPAAPQAPLHQAKAPVPGHYIVSLAPGADPVSVADGLGTTPRHIYRDAMVGFAASMTDLQVAQARNTPGVQAVEEDGAVVVPPGERTAMRTLQHRAGAGAGAAAGAGAGTKAGAGAAAGTKAAISWGLERINHREPGGTGFSVKSTGAKVTAYIVDTGIDYTHPEFGGRAAFGADQVGDGRRGADCAGHGTHVAGTVGGATTGVARRVKLVSVRVLNCDSRGSNSDIVAGLNWIAANAHKPAVANLSIGGPQSYALNGAVDGLSRAGVFTVVAAGNDNADACTTSPASAPEAFAVAATDQQDARASFSNHGSCVKLNAPGVAITSAYLNGSYTDMTGTSMAAPHVTGIAALYEDTHGAAAPAALAKWLRGAATPGIPATAPLGTPKLLAYTGGL